MKLTRRTLLYLVVVGLLGLLNLLPDRQPGGEDSLPTLAAVDRDAVTRVEISDAVNKVVLKQEDGAWRVTAPYEAPADEGAIKALLATFRKEISVDVQVDRENYDKYGLDAGKGLVFEAWTSGDEPALSFTVGLDANGGSSFVRLSGDTAVYRARVGGRVRYEKEPTAWRNRVLLDFESDRLATMSITRPDLTLHIGHGPSVENDSDGNPVPGPWTVDPSPDGPVDQKLVSALVLSLGRLRAGAILAPGFDGGFSPPLASLDVTLEDGTTKSLEVGSRTQDGASFARLKGGDEVYQVAGNLRTLMLVTPSDLRDRTLFDFTRDEVDTMTLEQSGATTQLRQDLATKLWSVVQPANVDVDIKAVFFAINTLATLRGDAPALGLSDAQAGLDKPAFTIAVIFLDGSREALEVGRLTDDPTGRPARYVRRQGRQEIFFLREATVTRLLAGFGKA